MKISFAVTGKGRKQMTRNELLQVAKPIIFSTEMVKKILDGGKTQTRRVVKNIRPKSRYKHHELQGVQHVYYNSGEDAFVFFDKDGPAAHTYNFHRTGDVLYVRETWAHFRTLDGFAKQGLYDYKADFTDVVPWKWRPSIHMPKEAARIFLRVTNVRAERLQDISANDCMAEGIKCDNEILNPDPETHEGIKNWNLAFAKTSYKELWNKLNAKRDGGIYTWDMNPWVFVYEFEKMEITDQERSKQ